MDVDALKESPIGTLVPISGTDPRTTQPWSYWAYLPDPLPVNPDLSAAAIMATARAGNAIARLDEAVAQLPRPEILVRPIIRREAASTSALEGTYASFEDVLTADFLDDREMSSEQREIRNYVHATEVAVAHITERRISRTFLGELQLMIVRGTRGETTDSGDIRSHQVAIGAHNKPIDTARFVPCPPGDQLEAGMAAWEDWVAHEDNTLIVAKMAMAHYQFETLHPYGDGNGRLGRLIALLQPMKAGELRWPILNIAPWFEARRDEYQDGLLNTTITGDYNPWIEFFATAVAEQAKEGLERIQRLMKIRDTMILGLREKGLRGSAIEIAEWLTGYPVIDVNTAATLTGKTFQATNTAIKKLVDENILTEITKKKQNRLFLCRDAWNATRWE
ncbi:Fic family protein [Rhodococcus sp. NPDC059968]|uniref:Fic family protein n=1 Tax=Rhodococcus sp. NPDC059968 TaxID=3347017 RepID=UPI00366E7F87